MEIADFGWKHLTALVPIHHSIILLHTIGGLNSELTPSQYIYMYVYIYILYTVLSIHIYTLYRVIPGIVNIRISLLRLSYVT